MDTQLLHGTDLLGNRFDDLQSAQPYHPTSSVGANLGASVGASVAPLHQLTAPDSTVYSLNGTSALQKVTSPRGNPLFT